MPTVWVQQLGPALYVESGASHTVQLRSPLCALATGFNVAPVGRVPEAMGFLRWERFWGLKN
jgi:hypothetical protein